VAVFLNVLNGKSMGENMQETLNKHRFGVWIAVMATVVLVQACAVLPFKSSEESLRQRVDQLMNAKVDNDWEIVYDLMDSSYKKRMTKKNFLNMNREIQFSNYRFESLAVDPSGDTAVVRVKFDMSVKVFDFENQIEDQQWIREKGNWYLKVGEEKVAATPLD
jgi:hypothetical protein